MKKLLVEAWEDFIDLWRNCNLAERALFVVLLHSGVFGAALLIALDVVIVSWLVRWVI